MTVKCDCGNEDFELVALNGDTGRIECKECGKPTKVDSKLKESSNMYVKV